MVWLLTRDLILFCTALFGLGAPWLALLRSWSPLERTTLAVAAALLTGWLAGFGVYVAGLSLSWFWLAPAAGLLLTVARPAAVLTLGRDPEVRGLLARTALLALWCLGWQALVASYSGAAWQGDWYEHYDRAHFFLARWPREFLFLDHYPLPARPPLVNVWSAVLMSASGGAFYHHQIFLTLLSSLVLLPASLLAARWNPRRSAQTCLLLIFMGSPLLVQNATFPWTKLPAAFFVLLAWTQLTAAPAPGRLLAAALALSGGLLAHYSTGVWVVAAGVAWLLCHGHRLGEKALRLEFGLATIGAAAVLLTWLAWAVAHYGLATTFTQNTTVSLAPALSPMERLATAGANLLHTVCPVSLVGLDHPLLAQASPLGRFRDGWFILYQLRLWWALGSVGGLVAVWLLWQAPRSADWRFGGIALTLAVGLNAVVHAQQDRLGLTHICLQPLVLLGLAWIAAGVDRVPRWLARLFAAGWLLDLLMGVGLHFLLQSRRFSLAQPDFTLAAQVNWQNKQTLGLTFLSDVHPTGWAFLLIGGAGLTAGWMWRRSLREKIPAPVPSAEAVSRL